MATVAVIDAATFRDRDTAAVMAVTVEEAAGLAGVSVRTIRRWLQRGYLPYGLRDGVKVIAPADLPAARRVAGGHGHGRGGRGHGRAATARDTARDTDADTLAVSLSPAARAQLAAVREELLGPLVARIGALEREVGRLTGEQAGAAELVAELRRRAEAAEAEREALRGELAAVASTVPPGGAVSGSGWWGRLRATFGGR